MKHVPSSFRNVPIVPRRGAALYVAVLSTALICSLLGMSALALVNVERRQAAESDQLQKARINARAAVELALQFLADDPNWRKSIVSGEESTPQSNGGNGTLSWVLEDSDGNLQDEDTQLTLKGIGRVGNVVQVCSVDVRELRKRPDFLRSTIHAGGLFRVWRTVTANSGPLSCNGAFTNNGTINGDIEAPLFANLGTHNGSFKTSEAKPLPPATVFDDIYLPLATELDWDDLPTDGDGDSVLSGLLSANSNPTGGSRNPNGIYHINIPSFAKLELRNLDIEGTLLATVNSGATFDDDGGGSWRPHNPRYAVVIVKAVGLSRQTVRFDGASGETYRGLIHVIGATADTYVNMRLNLSGLLVCEGDFFAIAPWGMTVTHDADLADTPPVGYDYTEPAGVITIPGTWRWDAAPDPSSADAESL